MKTNTSKVVDLPVRFDVSSRLKSSQSSDNHDVGISYKAVLHQQRAFGQPVT
jgi:hypothetical protein